MIYFWFVWVQLPAFGCYSMFFQLTSPLLLIPLIKKKKNAFQSNQYFLSCSNHFCRWKYYKFSFFFKWKFDTQINSSLTVHTLLSAITLLLHPCLLILILFVTCKVENSKGGPNLKVFTMESCWILDDKVRYFYI